MTYVQGVSFTALPISTGPTL